MVNDQRPDRLNKFRICLSQSVTICAGDSSAKAVRKGRRSKRPQGRLGITFALYRGLVAPDR